MALKKAFWMRRRVTSHGLTCGLSSRPLCGGYRSRGVEALPIPLFAFGAVKLFGKKLLTHRRTPVARRQACSP
jgi:hypothetical protein